MKTRWVLSSILLLALTARDRAFASPPPASMPASVDWRTRGVVTAVKNEQQCNSSWAFAATGALEGVAAIVNSTLLSFSEQQLLDCSASYGTGNCNGGLMDSAFKYAAAKGMETESTYPYTAAIGTCKYSASKKVFNNAGFVDVPSQDNDALAAAVAAGPVAAFIDASSSAFELYTGGVFNNPACGTSPNQGVLIVGYSSAGSAPYWIVKNSWGASWGESGYIRIAKQTGSGAGVCGIALDASYPTHG
jgi:cathepsin L